jgi:hypothetical protein
VTAASLSFELECDANLVTASVEVLAVDQGRQRQSDSYNKEKI